MRLRQIWGMALSSVLLASLALVACAPKTAPTATTPLPTSTAVSPTPAAGTTATKSGSDQEWQKVVAAARREGTVNLYTTFAPPELRVALNKAMLDNYGIKVEWLVAPGASNAERIRVEQKAGQYVADVWWTGFSTLLTKDLRSAGAVTSFTPPVVLQEPGVWKGKGVFTITDQGDALAVSQQSGLWPVVNTTILRPEEYPRSYADLLDAKWKGRIVMHDPTVPGGGNVLFGLVRKEFGLEYWQKMKAQNIAVIRDYGEASRRVAIGEAAIALGLNPSHYMSFLAASAPIKPIAIAEGAYRTSIPWYLINHAPHANAGKVLINWILTKEGQAMESKYVGDEPIRTDVPFKYPPQVSPAFEATTKWLVDSFDVKEELDKQVSEGTARTILGLK